MQKYKKYFKFIIYSVIFIGLLLLVIVQLDLDTSLNILQIYLTIFPG